jgi:hypothetical protein
MFSMNGIIDYNERGKHPRGPTKVTFRWIQISSNLQKQTQAGPDRRMRGVEEFVVINKKIM